MIAMLLTGCSKAVIDVSPRSITGTWVVSDAARSDGFGWQYFRSGLEDGVFDFYPNGSAVYDDGYNLMRGSWRIVTVIGGYYDQFGNYYDRAHDVWEVRVYDNNTGASVDMYFDDIEVYNNRIIATNYNGSYISRYTFRRI